MRARPPAWRIARRERTSELPVPKSVRDKASRVSPAAGQQAISQGVSGSSLGFQGQGRDEADFDAAVEGGGDALQHGEGVTVVVAIF